MLKIAVCDDSQTDVEMLEAAFDKLRHYVIDYDVYFSGKELLEYTALHGEVYHLYIFDIEMPDMNGLELVKEVRERDAKALFVFLTSYTQYVMEVWDCRPNVCYPAGGAVKRQLGEWRLMPLFSENIKAAESLDY